MKVHELKLNTAYYDDVKTGLKTFEIRKNDRDFKVGDVLSLTRWSEGTYLKSEKSPSPNSVFTGYSVNTYPANIREADTILMEVTYITDYEQKPGYVVMGIDYYYNNSDRDK